MNSQAEFITEGYLYAAGTLTCVDNECNGVLEDGSPEFPDRVLGRWVCRGWFVGDGFHTMSGPVVVTTQIYDLGDTPGADMLVTDGYELADFNVPLQRAISRRERLVPQCSRRTRPGILRFESGHRCGTASRIDCDWAVGM